jgi:hypothetical protein
VLVTAACGGSSVNSAPSPAATPEGVVGVFMKAAADSDLVKMAQYWGTAKGSAARTNAPPDYLKRVALMQVYLANTSNRITTADGVAIDTDRRSFSVEFVRNGCTQTVPFTVIRSGNAWLVTTVDLSAAGNPAVSCTVSPPSQ